MRSIPNGHVPSEQDSDLCIYFTSFCELCPCQKPKNPFYL